MTTTIFMSQNIIELFETLSLTTPSTVFTVHAIKKHCVKVDVKIQMDQILKVPWCNG